MSVFFGRLWAYFTATVFVFVLTGSALGNNFTIDDSAPEGVTYLPEGFWSFELSCPFCALQPDPSQAFNRTWHVSVFDTDDVLLDTPQINIAFSGTFVEVYAILADTIPGGLSTTDPTRMNFFIDGALSGSFIHNPGPEARFLYNQLVYSNTSLSDGEHVISLQPKLDASSIIFFDYLVHGRSDF
ncbi:hypothetical protein C8Q79DRAFT_109349 [Trametes meyenii]|nr:hypothetical protein C8Q79DRAFT_109349 [Trametes meyenii]